MLFKKKGFGVYFDKTKTTSGQRFYKLISEKLEIHSIPLKDNPSVILYNISAPLFEIIKAKLKSQKVIIRVDGLYFDELSIPFASTFIFPLNILIRIGFKINFLKSFTTFLANFFSENYASFLRIIFADYIIYQSKFSYEIHNRYFKNKNSSIIVNGAVYNGLQQISDISTIGNQINIVTIYDEWRPSKRINDLVKFIKWANDQEGEKIILTILGYTGKHSNCFTSEDIKFINDSNYVFKIPKFYKFSNREIEVLKSSHLYMTFSYRDSCPNSVIESMSYGLPVVAINSGGLPDIVQDAGVLLENYDFEGGYYSSHRFACNFPEINFSKVLEGVLEVYYNQSVYRERVVKRFQNELDIEMVKDKYLSVLNELAN